MKLSIEKVTIQDIDRQLAASLRNEIIKLSDGKIGLSTEYPALKELFYLLGGAFEDSKKGVHFL